MKLKLKLNPNQHQIEGRVGGETLTLNYCVRFAGDETCCYGDKIAAPYAPYR